MLKYSGDWESQVILWHFGDVTETLSNEFCTAIAEYHMIMSVLSISKLHHIRKLEMSNQY